MNPIPIPGCRHNVLGHNLKAIGLLRVLATCAAPEHCDPEAEGWWDLDSACFHIRSEKYATEDELARFLVEYYRPTPIFSPWNTGGGLDEKQEVVVTFSRSKTDKRGNLRLSKPTKDETDRLIAFVFQNRHALRGTGLKTRERVKSWRAKIPSKGEFSFATDIAPTFAKSVQGVTTRLQVKTSGEKATIAVVQRKLLSDTTVRTAIEAGRKYFSQFRDSATQDQTRQLLELFRDELPDDGSLAMDAVLTARAMRASDNPLFLDRGKAGNSELFRSFWSFFLAFKESACELVRASLFPHPSSVVWDKEKSPGTPFFPDAIKTYNNGLGWVVESFPFNALDYLLAVEGALALRGAASRTLAANSWRFAAFPFVFDSGEDLEDRENKLVGTASSIWLPLWDHPTTFTELSSFICDAQSRLPGKEARFAAEFARAVRAYGVDAGFAGWQEFRFKMKASNVRWVCTGRYVGAAPKPASMRLSDALTPLDECGFLDQFEPSYKGGKIDSRSPHPFRVSIGIAIEDCVAEATANNALEVLLRLYPAFAKVAQSKSFRETLRPRAVLFDPLPQHPWMDLLQEIDSSEFRIACALASITGFSKQADGSFSEVQPFLGSLLAVNLRYGRCQLAANSKQAVWSGTYLWHDLARVLSRRYMDSLKDDRPALMSPYPARLDDVLAFLNGTLDDHLIARWTEALSLVGWHWNSGQDASSAPGTGASSEDETAGEPAVPLAYAALRALMEVECEPQGKDPALWKKRRSQRPVALLCQRSSSSLALAVEDALRWLAIWGVPNRWGKPALRDRDRLAGRDVICVDHRQLAFSDTQAGLVHRLPAAVLIPLDWRHRGAMFRAVTLPQTTRL